VRQYAPYLHADHVNIDVGSRAQSLVADVQATPPNGQLGKSPSEHLLVLPPWWPPHPCTTSDGLK